MNRISARECLSESSSSAREKKQKIEKSPAEVASEDADGTFSSVSSIQVGSESIQLMHQSIQILQQQQIESNALLSKMIASLSGGNANSLPQRSESRVQREPKERNQQPKEIEGYWGHLSREWGDLLRDRLTEQHQIHELISSLSSFYDSDTCSMNNLHDSYCAVLSCSKGLDPFLGDDELPSQVPAIINTLIENVEGQLKTVQSMEEMYIIASDDLFEINTMKARLQSRLEILRVYRNDWALLNGVETNVDPSSLFSLQIIEQPMSYVLPPHDKLKKSILEGPFKVQFFAGPSQNYEVHGNSVGAVLLCEERGRIEFVSAEQIIPMELLTKSQDCAAFVATFPRFEIDLVGKKQFCILFQVTLNRFKTNEMSEITETIKINLASNIFSNIIHQDQWYTEAGRILTRSAFENAKESIPWPYFCNRLQMHFLKESRQNLTSKEGRRPLSLMDFKYLERFRSGRNEMLFSTFWGALKSQSPGENSFWYRFGSILGCLRFKKNVLQMWCRGYILGFCQKKEAEMILHSPTQGYANPGSFVVRFSESNPGLFACVFVAHPESKIVKEERERVSGHVHLCKHIVVEESALNQTTSLADFLVHNRDFEYLVYRDDDLGVRFLPVEEALQGYLAKRKQSGVKGESYLNSAKW